MGQAKEADKWYTVKCKTEISDGVGMVRGKVWERGTPEPEANCCDARLDPLGLPVPFSACIESTRSPDGQEIGRLTVVSDPENVIGKLIAR